MSAAVSIKKNNLSAYDCLPGLPTPRDSPVPDDESRGSSGSWDNNIYDPEVPNVTHWTVEQIIEYFNDKGFKTVSDVFKEQVKQHQVLVLDFSRWNCITSQGICML